MDSLGRTTCLTGTDAAGADYNATAGAQVLTGVTNDPATVSAAVGTITNSTLPGGVPGVALIKAIATAEDAVTAYGKTVATANASLDTNKDGSVSSNDASTLLFNANSARGSVSMDSTAVLTAKAGDAVTAVASAKAVVEAQTGGAAAVSAYDTALAADIAADAAINAAAKAAAEAGLAIAVAATGATVTLATLSTAAGVSTTFANVAAVSTFLADPASPAADRAKLVTELNKVATYGAEVVKAGDLGLAAAKTEATLGTADTALAAIDSDAAAPGSEGQDYIDAQTALKTANTLVENAKKADAAIATAKAVVDQHTALNKTVTDAKAALNSFETANSTKVDMQDLVNIATTPATGHTAKSDVFYFSAKAVAVNDGSIGSFGAGDSIVLGSSYTFSSGALTAGDNNKLEFFLVQNGSDTNVVIETAAYGSSTITTSASLEAAVITLTGVNVADLAVKDGIISHV